AALFSRTRVSAVAAVCAATLLAACGGGSSADPDQSEQHASQEVVAPSKDSASAPAASPDVNPEVTPKPETAKPTPAPDANIPGPHGQDASQYTLSFSEEFNNGFDRSLWNDTIWYEQSNPTTNYAVEDGKLKIWPQRDANGNFFNRTIDT